MLATQNTTQKPGAAADKPAQVWYTMTKPDALQGLIADEETGANIAVSYDAKHAQLIAAAPELLAACEAWEYARKEGGISMVDWFNVAWEKTQAAIAKATEGGR